MPKPGQVFGVHVSIAALIAATARSISFRVVRKLLNEIRITRLPYEEPDNNGEYFRAEVHLAEGGLDYDIMGWPREDVIGDIIDQYERHLQYLHLIR